jgi:hypothetical protein
VTITQAHSSCRCTVASAPTEPIPPGGTAEIVVRADWSDVIGEPLSRVTLETANWLTPRVELVIRGRGISPPAPPATSHHQSAQ